MSAVDKRPVGQGLTFALLCALLGACGSTDKSSPSASSAGDGGVGGTTSRGGASSGDGGAAGSTAAGNGNGGTLAGSGGSVGGSDAGGGSSGGGTTGGTTGGGGGGGGDTMLPDADKAALFEQAPHCTEFSFRLEGTLDGKALEDIRTNNFNAGFQNGSPFQFYTPEGQVPLAAGQVAMTFESALGLINGAARKMSKGSVVPPASFSHAGEELCITDGALGFPKEGDEQGVLKFWVRAARLGPDCAGAEVAVELRGCMY